MARRNMPTAAQAMAEGNDDDVIRFKYDTVAGSSRDAWLIMFNVNCTMWIPRSQATFGDDDSIYIKLWLVTKKKMLWRIPDCIVDGRHGEVEILDGIKTVAIEEVDNDRKKWAKNKKTDGRKLRKIDI